MKKQISNGQGAFDFIDRLIELFHHPAPQETQKSPSKGTSLNEQFETALVALEQTIEKHQREKEIDGQYSWKRTLKREDEETKKTREHHIYKMIREDIESTHLRLQTGISTSELDLLKGYLTNVAKISTSGENSHEVLPRCQSSILKRIHYEAGFLALDEMDVYLKKQNETWPTRVPRNPTTSQEEIEEIISHNRKTMRQNFINYSLHQSSDMIVGIVAVWKSDYPEVHSDLWNSVVFEAVATALRAKIMHSFSTRFRRDREFIESKVNELLGAKVNELNRTLQGGLKSLTKAQRVVSSSLRILDKVIPDLAWEHLQEVLPEDTRSQKKMFKD